MAWKREHLDFFAFENRVAEALESQGFLVHRNAAVGDQLVDLIAVRLFEGMEDRIAIEVKATNNPLEAAAVRQVLAQISNLVGDRHVDGMALISSAGFSRQARDLARHHKIVALTLEELLERSLPPVRNERKYLGRPKDSSINSDKKRVFVLMPFREEFVDTYDAIKSVAGRLGLAVERADDLEHNEQIIDVIYRKIEIYDYIIADLTGNNANVFYEVGYSHHVKPKQTVLLTKKLKKVPFDLRGRNLISYASIKSLKPALRKRLRAMLVE